MVGISHFGFMLRFAFELGHWWRPTGLGTNPRLTLVLVNGTCAGPVAYTLLATLVTDPGRLAVWARHADCAVRAASEQPSAHINLDGLLRRPPDVVQSAQTRYAGPRCCPAAPEHLQAM
jgi:hypothetical protein